MSVIEKTISPICDEDLFLGTNGIPPNQVTIISSEQATSLQGDCTSLASIILREAFEIRKQNQAKSKTAK